MAIRWGRICLVLLILILGMAIMLHSKTPYAVEDMLSSLSKSFAVQTMFFLGVPFGLLVLLVYTLSRMIRWFRKE